jgi:hypothetical protein
VITLAVAWTGNLLGVYEYNSTRRADAGGLRWPVCVPSDWPARPAEHERHRYGKQFGPSWVAYGTWHIVADDDRGVSVTGLTIGWPFEALGGYTLYSGDEDGGESRGIFYLDYRAISYRPLCPGFALDTAFYGTLVFLLWSAPAVLRRLRKRRGHCPTCGYDLRGAPAGPCPECGAPPPRPSRSSR